MKILDLISDFIDWFMEISTYLIGAIVGLLFIGFIIYTIFNAVLEIVK